MRPLRRTGLLRSLDKSSAVMLLAMAALVGASVSQAASDGGRQTTRQLTTDVVDLSAGWSHSCAVVSDGTVRCWGANGSGQLGDGTTTGRPTPVTVSGITTATQVAAGYSSTCARLSNGVVKCWGMNLDGQLGDGTTTTRLTPASVSGLTSAVKVATARYFSCALVADGTVRCWGGGGSGQLGNGASTDSLTPVTVSGISTATDIAVGDFYACAVLSSGAVMCWGSNTDGALGDGTTTNRPTPIPATGVTLATQIAAFDHTCARGSDARLQCWGWNGWGQVGDNTRPNKPDPLLVSILNVAEVAAGGSHTCVRHVDGTVRCWGLGQDGQLGNGTTDQMRYPSTAPPVSGVSTATRISAGAVHSCALLADGTVRCWGANSSGQLGNGTTQGSLVPVNVTIGEAPPPPPLAITTIALPGGTTGQAYSQSISATGGVGSYSWSISAGALPPGLSLSPTGTPSATLSGSPTSVGTYNFTVQVTDSATPASNDTQQLSIAVAAPPAAPNPPLLDDFNRPAENPVSQNGSWGSTGLNGGAGAPLSQNKLRSFPAGGGYSYRLALYAGNDMEAGATITSKPSTNHSLSLFVCLQNLGTAAWDGYEVRATVKSGVDLWELRRTDNAASTVLASGNFEITTGGKMVLRRVGNGVQLWWKASSGGWAEKLTASDPTYAWGRLGVGGSSSGALDDFSGGSLLSLLDQYVPEIRYHEIETYRADSPKMMTDNYVPGEYTNRLLNSAEVDIAASDPSDASDTLAISYLNTTYPAGSIASNADHIDAANSYALDAQRLHADPTYSNRVFGRQLALSDGGMLLQYWTFYYYNPKTYLWMGSHEGDWEFVQVRLDRFGVPAEAAYSQHNDGERCEWIHVQRNSLGRPITYAAEGSHANFFSSGYHLSSDDYTSDLGEHITPLVVEITNEPGWVQWPGKWGGSEASPRFPKWQGTWAWSDPEYWASQYGCTEGQTQPLALHPSAGRQSKRQLEAGLRARPPAPTVTATRRGKVVIIHYALPAPRDQQLKVWQLITSIKSNDRRYIPLTVRSRVTSSHGVVRQPLGLGRGPWQLQVISVAVDGSRSSPVRRTLR